MNKKPLATIGYNFVPAHLLPEGNDEYHLRNFQNKTGLGYRNLTAYEIEVLVRNRNTTNDWNRLHVSDLFNPELVKNCKFYGLVRIGKLESIALEYHNVCMPVGLYDSTIISCDFGDNVVINNVNYMAHYIVGNEVMIININELHCTNHAKFGNGILKEDEPEEVRIWMEVCNENGGRKILPFNGMLPGDAWLWSRYRSDEELLSKLKEFTEKKFDIHRGYYGKIGSHSVLKNTAIIKDVWIGPNAYIKGANKLKNLTINSSAEAPSQIGEGCELVNGIVGFGCRVFYGVKAVRFFMASHSQLKYGARLLNSYLGNNSTISCCEVLNSLIFPSHEQHHNNSFLCASLVMGQSNIAAGATIGSNHNSRAADGEIVAARGFWPGLCVSLKHNSKFASFTLIAKGDYSNELNITLPFSLVTNDVAANRLVVMPAYWPMYNMYALARNPGKLMDRDKRTKKLQTIEYAYLAPDTVNEIFDGLNTLRRCVALSVDKALQGEPDHVILAKGEALLTGEGINFKTLEIFSGGFENSLRPTQLLKVQEAYKTYKRLVIYYGVEQIMMLVQEQGLHSFEQLSTALLLDVGRTAWVNFGGQLIPKDAVNKLIADIKNGIVSGWNGIHQFYATSGKVYAAQKRQHAFASLLEVSGIERKNFTATFFLDVLNQTVETRQWMTTGIYESRAKDYQSSFRQMVYDSVEEMETVIGKLNENAFIRQQEKETASFVAQVGDITKLFNQPEEPQVKKTVST